MTTGSRVATTRWGLLAGWLVTQAIFATPQSIATGPDQRRAISAAQGSGLVLPIEVLGNGRPDQPVIAETALHLTTDALAHSSRLALVCHRCGFYGAPEYEAVTAMPTRIKASVRVLGSRDDSQAAGVPWVDITDANVVMRPSERLSGGINGGFYTTHFYLVLDAASRARLTDAPAGNRIQFRFNGTDGESNGYRILDVHFQDDAGNLTDAEPVVRVDPAAERRAETAWSDDAQAGRALWYAHDSNSKSSIVPRKLKAACASCHAEDGRDLAYFNYSDHAIEQRARFHGLTDTQARQVRAFLRASLKDVPIVDRARPWNPPYQPGPGLDCSGIGCEQAWAAGAGLEAVLDSSSDAAKALFGQPLDRPLALTQQDVDAVMDADATLNVRQMPVAMQMPDWNAWLPTIDPEDVWPQGLGGDGSFLEGERFSGSNNQRFDPYGRYTAADAWLAQHRNPNGVYGDWSHLSPDERDQAKQMFYLWGWEGYSYLGGGRGNHIAGGGLYAAQVGAAYLQSLAAPATMAYAPAAGFTTAAFIERAVASLLHWNTIKQWELAQRYGLEGNQQWFIGDKGSDGQWHGRGEAHGWPFNTVSLFYLAPHMTYQSEATASGVRENINAWETGNVVASYYRTNQWYQLQMTVNAGGQSDWVNYPMDWPYLTQFDDMLADAIGDATPEAADAQHTHLLRLLQNRIKAAQYVNNDLPLYDPGQPDLVNNVGRYSRAQAFKHLALNNFLDRAFSYGTHPSRYVFLDGLAPGLYVQVLNGALHQFNTLYSVTAPEEWRRCEPGNTQLGEDETYAGFRYCLDATRKPLGVDGSGRLYMVTDVYYRPSTEQSEQFSLHEARRLGLEPGRVQQWSDWQDRVWPAASP